jgi:long-chain fatty acid transport protein
MLSVGAGVQIEYFDARLTNAVDFGSIAFAASMGACFPLCVPTARDGRAEFEADDEVGVGYNVGVLFEPIKGTRFGAAFRSMIHHDVQGDVDFFIPASVTSLPGGLGPFISATFADTGARTEVTLPEMVTFGVYHELNPQWAVMAEGQWTNWSRLEELRIQFDSGLPDNVTELEWEDSWYGALGVIFRPDHRWAFRAGVGFDESPVPDATRTPRLPDEDRIWLSAGAGMQVTPGGRVDLGYTHIFIDDASINLLAGGPTSPNFFRGNLTGEFESAVDIVAIQGSIAF